MKKPAVVATVRILIVGCLLLLTALSGRAQAIRFQTFGGWQGLTSNRHLSLAQDSAGLLWLGTADGLYRYDGTAFRAFTNRRGDRTSLPSDEVLNLRTAADGTLLVGTNNGFSLYDRRTDGFRSQPLHIKGQVASQANWLDGGFAFDARGRLWIAAIQGVLRAPGLGQPATAIPVEPTRRAGLTSGQTRLGRHCLAPDGRLWIATVRGINVYDPATNSFWNHRNNPRHWAALRDSGIVRVLTLDAGGRVWYSIWERGLTCFDPATNQLQHWQHRAADRTSLPGDLLNVLTFDRAGALWIGTLLSGGARFDPATGRCERLVPNAADPTALPSAVVNDILEDRQGNVWFATDGGLALHSPLTRPFSYWAAPSHPQTGTPPELGPILPDARGRLWVGTYSQGLLLFDAATGRFRRVGAPPPPDVLPPINPHDQVWTLAPAPNQRFWVGTQAGLLLFDPLREQWEPLPPGLPDIVRGRLVVTAALRARDGAAWFATFKDGLVRYDPVRQTARVFIGADPAGGDTLAARIWRLAQDSAGNIWVAGVHGRGVSRLAAGTWRVQSWKTGTPHGPTDDDCYALLAVPGGDVWLGTRRRGLNRYVPGAARKGSTPTSSFRETARDDGLTNNFVAGLARAPNGHVWAGTYAGLNELNPRTGRLHTYGLAEGLPEMQFGGGAWADAGGALWFTTENYLLRILPERLLANRRPPAVALTSFQVNGRPRALPAPDSMLHLPPGETTLAFEFAAANLLAPNRNLYSWKLDGADRRWSAPGSQRAVTYANLPPGRYTLRVRAANNDGVWNRTGLSLRLHLLPPWHRTWWFYALAVLAGAGILYAFYRQRLARALALERARNQIARDLHDDIGSTLSSILIQSRVPTATVEQAQFRLGKISEYAQPMLQAMDEIVWAVNPRFDPLPAVVARMRTFAAETLEPRGIALHFAATGPLDRHALSLQRRREFYLIFKEAVHNAARYSAAANVWVTVSVEGRRIHLEIRDDGQGFDPAALPRGSGNGLRNQRQRAATLGARLTLTTAPGAGTRLVVEV